MATFEGTSEATACSMYVSSYQVQRVTQMALLVTSIGSLSCTHDA